jgi:murein L,D-transpeptidase YafK
MRFFLSFPFLALIFSLSVIRYPSPAEALAKARTLSERKTWRKLSGPITLQKRLLVKKSEYKAYYLENGVVIKTYEIALGQEPVGAKEKQGDLKTPEGIYKIIQKTKGPFDKSNWVNAYLGTRWIRLDYPNADDAKRGLADKRITKQQADAIINAHKNGKWPPKNTPLGGGIGIHGWLESDWRNNESRGLTWGCVSFHNKDLEELYELCEMGMQVEITK